MAAQEKMKPCETCGREIEYRKKWAKNWDEIKYCSDRCRQNKVRDPYESLLLEALAKLPRDQSMDPTLVLSALEQDAATLEKVKAAARRLVAKGSVVILQKNRVVDPSTARGPIQIRLVKKD